MPIIHIVRTSVGHPSAFASTATPGPDFLRGGGANDVILRPLTTGEKAIVAQLSGLGASQAEIYDAVLLGEIRRPLTPPEAAVFPKLFDPAFAAAIGFAVAESLDDALSILTGVFGVQPFDTGPAPDNSAFGGNDRILGDGGDDYIADLLGDNLVSTDEGDDRILLGAGNDHIFDRGGDNVIDDLGGNNVITARDGDDTVTTGAGDDHINVFDGQNTVDAGDGNNMVRGGEGLDAITVGTGNDFVEVRTGSLDQTDSFDLPFIGVLGFLAHNVVQDAGGSDNIRASGNSRVDQPGFPDQVFNGDDLVLSDIGGVFGNDRIELGGGNNIVVDLGGNDIVRTLEGDDIIFTSFAAPGNDDISSGEGNDTVNPGAGSDTVRGGLGADVVFLENDGDRDALPYLDGDQSFSPATTDIVLGFDGGIDVIDVSTLGMRLTNLLILNAAALGISVGDPASGDIMVAWDTQDDGVLNTGDFFSTVLADFAASSLLASNFVFAPDTLV